MVFRDKYPELDHDSLVFASVFPIPALTYTTPTPIATPDLNYVAPGQSFGGFGSQPSSSLSPNPAARLIKKNIAWSTATRFLHLPRPEGGSGGGFAFRQTKNAEVIEALQFLLVGDGAPETWDEITGGEGDILQWYMNDIRSHFRDYAKPPLGQIWGAAIPKKRAGEAVVETIKILQQAQALYMQPLNDHVLPMLATASKEQADSVAWYFKRELQSLSVNAVDKVRFLKTLSFVLYDVGCSLFRIHLDKDEKEQDPALVKKWTLQLLFGLKEVGFGRSMAQRAFAESMNIFMNDYVVSKDMRVDWQDKESVTIRLHQWIQEGFAPFVTLILQRLGEQKASGDSVVFQEVTGTTQVQQWQAMALGRLGRARVENLFEYIVEWPRSRGAILDLKVRPLKRLHYK
jgi:anaphase-promoting complex subunit 2